MLPEDWLCVQICLVVSVTVSVRVIAHQSHIPHIELELFLASSHDVEEVSEEDDKCVSRQDPKEKAQSKRKQRGAHTDTKLEYNLENDNKDGDGDYTRYGNSQSLLPPTH